MPEGERPKVLFVIDSLGMLLTPTDVNQFEAGEMKGDMGRKPTSRAPNLIRFGRRRRTSFTRILLVTRALRARPPPGRRRRPGGAAARAGVRVGAAVRRGGSTKEAPRPTAAPMEVILNTSLVSQVRST